MNRIMVGGGEPVVVVVMVRLHIQYPGEYGCWRAAGVRAEAGECSGRGVYLLRSSEDVVRLGMCCGGGPDPKPPRLLAPGPRLVGGTMEGGIMRRKERGVGGEPSLRTPRDTWFSSRLSTRFMLERFPCGCRKQSWGCCWRRHPGECGRVKKGFGNTQEGLHKLTQKLSMGLLLKSL